MEVRNFKNHDRLYISHWGGEGSESLLAITPQGKVEYISAAYLQNIRERDLYPDQDPNNILEEEIESLQTNNFLRDRVYESRSGSSWTERILMPKDTYIIPIGTEYDGKVSSGSTAREGIWSYYTFSNSRQEYQIILSDSQTVIVWEDIFNKEKIKSFVKDIRVFFYTEKAEKDLIEKKKRYCTTEGTEISTYQCCPSIQEIDGWEHKLTDWHFFHPRFKEVEKCNRLYNQIGENENLSLYEKDSVLYLGTDGVLIRKIEELSFLDGRFAYTVHKEKLTEEVFAYHLREESMIDSFLDGKKELVFDRVGEIPEDLVSRDEEGYYPYFDYHKKEWWSNIKEWKIPDDGKVLKVVTYKVTTDFSIDERGLSLNDSTVAVVDLILWRKYLSTKGIQIPISELVKVKETLQYHLSCPADLPHAVNMLYKRTISFVDNKKITLEEIKKAGNHKGTVTPEQFHKATSACFNGIKGFLNSNKLELKKGEKIERKLLLPFLENTYINRYFLNLMSGVIPKLPELIEETKGNKKAIQ